MMMAARGNFVQFVKMLIPVEHGMQDRAGNTALHVACQHNCFESAQLLLGYEYGYVNNKRLTPYQVAV